LRVAAGKYVSELLRHTAVFARRHDFFQPAGAPAAKSPARELLGKTRVFPRFGARFVPRIVASLWRWQPFFAVREFQQFDNSPAAIDTPARTCRKIGEVFGHPGQKRSYDFGGALKAASGRADDNVFHSETNVGFGQTKQPELVGKAQ